MDWNDLKWFVHVADCRSYRDAATQVGISHSTLSRRVRNLEESLGVRLFERLPEGLELTDAGRDLRRSCDALVHDIADVERRMAGWDQSMVGPIDVTVANSIAPWVAPALAEFSALHPDVVLEVSSTEDHTSLTRREADVAVRLTRGAPDDLIGRKVGTAMFAVYGARHIYPEPPDVLDPAEYDWVSFGGKKAAAGARLEALFPAARLRATADSPIIQRELIASGVGVGLSLCLLCEPDPRLIRLGTLEEFPLAFEAWVLFHKDLRSNVRVRALADHVYRSLLPHRAIFAGEQ